MKRVLKFWKKMKSNKAFDVPLIGSVIIMTFITGICLQLDMFWGLAAKTEVQSIMELSGLYSLVKSVDINEVRKGNMVVDESSVAKYYKDAMNHSIAVTDNSYFKSFSLTSVSVTMKNTAYHFADAKERDTATVRAVAVFTPKKLIKANQKPITVSSSVRIFIDDMD